MNTYITPKLVSRMAIGMVFAILVSVGTSAVAQAGYMVLLSTWGIIAVLLRRKDDEHHTLCH